MNTQSPFRSNQYDHLRLSIQQLQRLQDHKSDILIKAHDGSLEDFCEDIENMDRICKSVRDQFESLKQDFYGGRINRARYQDHLLPIKQFLEANRDDFKVKSFPFEAVKKEISKFW